GAGGRRRGRLGPAEPGLSVVAGRYGRLRRARNRRARRCSTDVPNLPRCPICGGSSVRRTGVDDTLPEGIPELTAVRDLLAAHVPGVGPLRACMLSGGRSNLTYSLTDGAGRWVLRR